MFFVEENSVQNDETYVVCIGASAGGLEAINDLFDHVSNGENVAFIVVQHLSSDYKSLLVELLTKHTHLPVEEARHKQKVKAGTVYVIPNNRDLTISNGLLVLAQKEFEKGPNTAIDTFLQSLAQDQGNRAIAVLLSGTGTDGTKGIEAIKNYGGFVIVQDPATAKFDGMPKSAIASGYTDLILPPREVYKQIINYIDGLVPYEPTHPRHHQEAVQSILITVFKKTGYDFKQYKQATIFRRISRRMQLVKLTDIEEYEDYIRTHDDEPPLLAKEFFISVTNFFRDKDAFVCLYNEVIIPLVQSKEEHDVLRVWVTACSTGQEAYTMAILIDQALRQEDKELEIKIFASDIDKSSIEFASKGRYQRNQLLGLDKKVLQEYFTGVDDEMMVIARLRKQIVFATHDLLKDPPFINNDLVSCRNLLIYLNPPLQENVLGTLNFALSKGGYLFLGVSENLSLLRKNFQEVDSKWRIYKRTTDQNRFVRRTSPSSERSSTVQAAPVAKLKADVQLSEDFKNVLADKLGFAAVYINENYDIKEGIGSFKRYLSLPEKLNTSNILKMASPELSGVLSTALRKCIKENKNQTVRNIRLHTDEHHRMINIFIYPPRETVSTVYMLVVFADCIIEEEKSPLAVQDITLLQKDHYVQQLEDELRETRVNLQMAIESLETTNEELQSSNEELQSANEELQSSNEELQSLNEELHTLNTEHQMRIKELVELNDDITNYLQTSLIGQIFLDQKLRIRRFNKAAAAVINIIENDIGRPIDHITNFIKASTFFEDIRKSSVTGKVIEREFELQNGKFYLIRILPYIRQDGVQDGLVITLIDISTIRNLNNLIKSVFDASANPILVFEAQRDAENQVTDFVCKIASQTAYLSFGRQVQDDLLSLRKDFPELANGNIFRKYIEVVESSQPASIEVTFIRNGVKCWYQASINKMQDGFVLILTDITGRKGAEEKLRKNYNELIITKETLRELNNQLEVKVKDRTRDLKISEERFRTIASLTNDVIWDWNFANNELWWSDSYYELFGFPQHDPAMQKHVFRLQHIHPHDRKRVEDAFNAALQNGEQEFNVAYRYQKNNGEYAHILDRATLLVEQGIPYRMIGAMVDVTKLEQSKQQLQQTNAELQLLIQQFTFVTDFMPQMVWATQPDGYYDFYNKQWYDYTGLDYDQTKDKGWLNVIHPEDHDKAWKAWEHSLKTGLPYEMEYRVKRYDGVYRWFLARALPMRDENGSLVKWFGTFTDIHDQKMSERLLEEKVMERTRELKLLNERLEASNSDLMQFASVASHDLKEPLRKIHFFCGLIKDQFPDDVKGSLANYIERITRASSRATNLITDILSYSRLSSENMVEKVDLDVILQDILQDLELVISEKRAIIDAQKLPVIDAVAGQMRQLLQNIIANAIKFHKPEESPSIDITCKKVNKTAYYELGSSEIENFYEIRIKDKGIGFNEQYSKKIFSLFQRLNSKDTYDGTGIGLAIAKKIVEGHHGIILAKGVENEGAEFIIVLPENQPVLYQSNENFTG